MNRATPSCSRSALTLIGVCVLVLSGCYRVESTIQVENDGSGQVGYVMAFSYDAFGQLDATEGASRDEFCDEVSSDQGDIPDNATVEPYDADGYCGVRVTVDVPANENFSETLANLSGDQPSELQDFQIEKITDDQWTFSLSLEDSELNELDSADPSAPDAESMAIIEETLQISYHVELPGMPGENNADNATTDDNRTLFEWKVKASNSLSSLTASTTPENGGDNSGSAAVESPPTTTDRSSNSAATDAESLPDAEATPDTDVSETTGIEILEFADDESASAGPLGDAPDTDSGSNSVLVAGLFAILTIFGGIVLLVLKWPSKTFPASSDSAGFGPLQNTANNDPFDASTLQQTSPASFKQNQFDQAPTPNNPFAGPSPFNQATPPASPFTDPTQAPPAILPDPNQTDRATWDFGSNEVSLFDDTGRWGSDPVDTERPSTEE